MLPPQLKASSLSACRQSSLSARSSLTALPSAVLRTTTAYHQSRGFRGWGRSSDWTSHLDPLYHRFTRYRSFKTKAKLLEKIRRRGKFDWDITQRPFFTPRQIRWASHWNGKGPERQWQQAESGAPDPQKDARNTTADERGFELSQREKEWKQQMEAMRKRIEQDPYEAIFGKRFEPFWSPLVPSWMREEMGLQGWPKTPTPKRDTPPANRSKATEDPINATPLDSFETFKDRITQKSKEWSKPEVSEVKAEVASATKTSAGPSTYSTYSSTSWDSWTKKARRTEWDSVSGQTKRYEYDPISNRMVQVQGPKSPDAPAVSTAVAVATSHIPANRSVDMQSLINTPSRETRPRSLEVPVKKATELRAPIPIPTQSISPPGSSEQASTETAKNSVSPSNSAKLANLPKDDMDILTASDVRASMGKLRYASSLSPIEKAAMERSFEKRIRETDAEATAILESRDAAKMVRQSMEPLEWDKAEQMQFLECELASLQRKKSKLIHDEGRVFHISKLKREVAKLDSKIEQVASEIKEMTARTGVPTKRLEPSLERANAFKSNGSKPLQTSMQRMPAKEIPKAVDIDDAAAHESTEPIERPSSVPKAWAQQAELLQADRVQRTASERPPPMRRWLDDMEARKAAYESTKTPSAEEQAAATENAARLEKANSLLETEVKEQKFRMQAHENRYAHKIRSLRQDLETAYKQSAKHSEMHVDRVKALEAELEKTQKAIGQGQETAATVKVSASPASIEMRGEGDVCFNASKYTSSGKWYKQPASTFTQFVPKTQDLAKSEQKARDQALVREVREIYEQEYGVIDTQHRQPSTKFPIKRNPVVEMIKRNKQQQQQQQQQQRQVVEVESDVDLGEELAKHEKTEIYAFKHDDLESELAGKTVNGQASKPAGKVNVAKDEQKGEYGYKKDDLETEMKAASSQQEKVDGYGFEKDGLESELRETSPQSNKIEGYGFRKDSLEGELSQQSQQRRDSAMASHYPDKSYGFRHDDLEADLAKEQRQSDLAKLESEVALHEKEAHDAQSQTAMPHESSSKASESSSISTSSVTLQWEEPPVYKVLAYDAGNDIVSSATTTSNFTGSEEPISIPQALSQLYQPARFVSYFAGLQKDGYQVIHATRDLLVFKKVKSQPATSVQDPAFDPSLVDHSIIKPKENALAQEAAEFYDQHKPAAKIYDPTSIENGKLMPYENAMAQEAANFHDQQLALNRETPAANPVDGTMTPRPAEPAVSTGNFASPTGFVNHDPVFPDLTISTTAPEDPTPRNPVPESSEEDVDYIHYPRVRREEPIFSGTRRVGGPSRMWNKHHERHHQRSGPAPGPEEYGNGEKYHRRSSRRDRRRRGSALKWMLSVGLAGAAVTYVIGVAAEAARQTKRDRERWEEVLEGKRGRWE